MTLRSLLLAALASTATATATPVRLYSTFYDGTVSTLELTGNTLKNTSISKECGNQPTWIAFETGNLSKKQLYCIDEGWSGAASINTLAIAADGSLKRTAAVSTLGGPVASQWYNENKAIALANYGSASISTFLKTADGKLSPLQNITFNTPPGPRPEQEKSHPHEAIIDPTGKFLIFPDLGADVVRVYCFDPKTSQLSEHPSIKTKAGTGPRHAVFWQSPKSKTPKGTKTGDTYLFVIHELGNFITSYKVTYPNSTISFSVVQTDIKLYNGTTPEGTRAAEIAASPDGRFIIASNRNATILTVPNIVKNNSTQIPSDTLAIFKPNDDGTLTFSSLAPSGGLFPRHFTINRKGDMVAVGNQNSGYVTIWRRNIQTGQLTERIAQSDVLGNLSISGLSSVFWYE